MSVAREQQLLQAVPDVLNFNTLLYVGASRRRQETLHLFVGKRYKVAVVEVWPRNAMYIARHIGGVGEVICADVRNLTPLRLQLFDVVMWWHGPEHVPVQDLAPTLLNLQALARHVVVLASPWGRYEQGAEYGNPYERHHCPLYQPLFGELGYNTSTLGRKDTKGSNLLAWLRTDE